MGQQRVNIDPFFYLSHPHGFFFTLAFFHPRMSVTIATVQQVPANTQHRYHVTSSFLLNVLRTMLNYLKVVTKKNTKEKEKWDGTAGKVNMCEYLNKDRVHVAGTCGIPRGTRALTWRNMIKISVRNYSESLKKVRYRTEIKIIIYRSSNCFFLYFLKVILKF